MTWTDRQQAMLAAMGLRQWPVPAAPMDEAVAVASLGVGETRTAVSPPGSLPQTLPQAPATQPPHDAPQRKAAPAARGPTSAPATGNPTAPAVTALRDDIAQLDWPALRNRVAGCRACGLCESRTQTVFGVGHQQAHWMVVGEAPGEQEDRVGEPFVGPAGQLLDRMLAALQLTRAEDGPQPPSQRVYIANTLKCRPPRNRNPAPDEMAQCEPYLQRQIELLQPRIILAMGAFAVKALLRSEQPVGKLRGQVHRYHGVPLVVTYHPAYLLRSLQEKAKAWEDLCLAAQVVEDAQRAGAVA